MKIQNAIATVIIQAMGIILLGYGMVVCAAVSTGLAPVYRSGTAIIERYHKNQGTLTAEEQAFAEHALAAQSRSAGYIQSTLFPMRCHYPSDEFRDLAEHILDIAEESWDVQVNQWGFPAPPPDCGIDESDDLDIHIQTLPEGIGGYAAFRCYIESTPETDAASFIAISDALPDTILRGVVTHEFNHVLQNAIDYWEVITFKEYTSTWAMEWMYPADDQYFQYLRAYQRNPHWPVHRFSTTNTYQYGGCMFLHFLSEYYAGGDPGIVLDIWNACVQTEFYNDPDFIEALKTVIPEYTNDVDTFDDMMAEYAAWRAITSGRDDGVHFADGGLWPPGAEVVMDTVLDLAGTYPQTRTPVNPPFDYGFSYFHLINPASAPNGVMLEFSGDTGVDWAVVVIECRNNHALHVKHRLDINSGQGHMLLTPVMLGLADEFIVGVVNLSHDGFNTNLPGDERQYTVTLRKGVPDTALRLWTDAPVTGPGMDYCLNLEMEYYGQPAELDLWLFVEIEGLFFSLFTNAESAPTPIAIPVLDGFAVTTPVLRFDMPQLDTGIHLRWHAALLSGDTVHDYCVIRSNLATMFR